ncbi:MAG: formylmethanofuran dehydrogenase subunit C [Promethearchaeota archaeon]
MTKTLTFILKKETDLSLEVEKICPDFLAGKTLEEIKKLDAYEGKNIHKYEDIFDISGEVADNPADMKIIVNKSTIKIKRIGENMTAGEIEINGDAGMHVGEGMKGGQITVNGNVDHYAGCEMQGGTLLVKGNAGNYLGSAYRGDWRGMKGGKIIVEGNAGFEIGAWLRGTKKTRAKGEPLIHVKGNVGLHAGHHNHGGFIIIEGDCDGRAGSGMARGDIVILGKPELLASYIKEDAIAEEVPQIGMKGPFTVYKGDMAINGKGKIYVKK